MTQRLPPSDPDVPCSAFGARLAAVECRDAEPGVLERLACHAAACGACRARHGARLAQAQGVVALRSRRVPAGLLDGLTDDVLARARSAPRGGGMSRAFLDAPQSLARWRAAAAAAGVLVVVLGGLAASGRIAWREGGTAAPVGDGWVALDDVALAPRAGDPWDAAVGDERGSERLLPVALGRRNPHAYWDPAGDRGHVIIHPVPPVRPAAGAPAPAGR